MLDILALKYPNHFADQLLYGVLITLGLNAFSKIILLRKHKLQIEAKVNTNNLHDILDSNIVEGTDKVETTLTYPTINMILLGAQFIFSLIVVFLFFQAYEFVDRFWIRVFTTLVLMGSSVATIIYVVYLNEEELE